MAAHNVETLRRWADAARRGDLAAAETELDRDGVEIADSDILESTSVDSHGEEQPTILSGRRRCLRSSGSSLPIALTRDDALVAKFRDGKIVRFAYYNDQAQARA